MRESLVLAQEIVDMFNPDPAMLALAQDLLDTVEAMKAFMVEACRQLATYRAALERIDQSPLGTDDFAMRVIAQQAIASHDPEYPNNRRKP